MPLHYTPRAGYGVATLAWPDAGCLLDAATAADLASLAAAARDEGLRALVLAADGPAFCRGEVDEPADAAGRTPAQVAVEALAALPMPVLCAIEGDAWDAGLELALACDLRLAGAAASLRMAHLASGLVPQAGGTQRLPRVAGKAAALRLLLLAETLDAAEARTLGLVQRLTPAGGALAEAEALAARLASGAPIATQYLKEAVHRGMECSLADGLQLEADLYFLLQTTADRMEGIRSFQEKRPPRFEGR